MRKERSSYSILMGIIIIVVLILDQGSKAMVLAHLHPGEPVYLVGDWFRFYLVFNSGAAFSMGTSVTWVFTVIQWLFFILVILAHRRVHNPVLAISLALIAGGAAGNGLDRLFRAPAFFLGHVVDFISVGNFAIFNIADSAITIGVFVLIWAMLRQGESRREEVSRG